MSLSNMYENNALDDVCGDIPANAFGGSARYLALFISDPGETGSLAGEISGGSYARVDCNGLWAAASGGSKANSSALTFPTATADWADGSPNQVTHWALCDAASAGNVVISGALTTARTVLSGDTFQFAIGQLTLTAD